MGKETLPALFTYPFRYTAHPLCERAATLVADEVQRMGFNEGKMFGVLVVKTSRDESLTSRGELDGSLLFLAAYSGQLLGSYHHPWFVPPVVDYLDPDSYFQREQAEIVAISRRMEEMSGSEERRRWQLRVALLRSEREAAVAEAKHAYAEGKIKREERREEEKSKREKEKREEGERESGEREEEKKLAADLIKESQQQKADIQRAKQLHKEEIAALEALLTEHNATYRALCDERKQRSEALQQWLFRQFNFLNARGECKNLLEIFAPSAVSSCGQESCTSTVVPPSGAGECCAPKLLQAAFQLGLQPVAMAEFWLGPSKPGHYRQPGAFFPACRRKCYPILGHMLKGLPVEPDPAEYYDNKVLARVRVLWEDESLAVILKPEGWCSIPGKSDQPNLLDEAHRLWPGISGSVIVHRLDQDTSGLMVIAKNARIHHALSQQFERREVCKSYVALLEGREDNSPLRGELRWPSSGDSLDKSPLWGATRWPSSEGTMGIISLPLGPDLDNLPRQRVDFEHGKEAITEFEVLGHEECNGMKVTRVRFRPQTGRTHQLRVHSAAPEGLGTPILGDRLYGHLSDRLYLHAEFLEFTHPLTGEKLHFTAPAPF